MSGHGYERDLYLTTVGEGQNDPRCEEPPLICVCRDDEAYCGAWDCKHRRPSASAPGEDA